MDSGTENMDWVAAALKPHRRVHPGRRRDQHRGRRDQRRRPAVLERRGHHAHAHQGHPGDDAGLGDGADRQAVAGLLRRRVGRGQLRHRRLRPGDGAERPGPVLGAGPGRRPRRADGALRAQLRRAGRDRDRGRRAAPTRTTGTSPATRTRYGHRLQHGRRDLLGDGQPGSQEAVRHPHRDARGGRPGPPGAGALGRHGRRGDRGGAGRAPRRPAGMPARDRVPVGAAARLPAHRRAGQLHGGHPVPGLVEEGGPGDQRGQRQPATGRAGEPVRFRRVAGVDAQAATGVRRRDRPGHRELRRPDRVLRDLPLPRRRVRGVLQGAQPGYDGARRRGLVRLGDRRRPRGRGGVQPAR